ncbi:hydrogenase expression/formation protein HypE [Aequitasia blattaphilus]|uniref:AIR synthase-related protein n=1 Tax=Aequitasia blattaphilus TaxID=2949332 RepID=A0ABT1E7V6_9FIRM|nr:AIR synthase-related protein [Aequitasia blattaphilus]MCP1100941.1 AIR synthase-related protein [Aequitasia blattaphilus]MCR8613581.1 AIR synthase-related protein [Aequitasia blattaphilus]
MEIILGNYAGLFGTIQLVKEKEAELSLRFPGFFLKNILEIEPFWEKNVKEYIKHIPDTFVINGGRGGIYAALYQLSIQQKTGFEIYLKEIPICQETIEITEVWGLNPYCLNAKGCVAIATKNGEEVLKELRKEQIISARVGGFTKGKERKIFVGESWKRINKPGIDELERI